MNTAYEMTFCRPAQERSAVTLTRYSPVYKEQYRRIYNACFHDMRECLDIQPYDFIQDDSFFESGMGNVYLLIDDGEMIGGVTLKGNEIDDLIVSPAHQGKGYGRQILLWATENIDTDSIILHVAAVNEKALSLYKKYGFEVTRTIEF